MSSGTLSGVIYAGTLSLANGSTPTIVNGITFTGASGSGPGTVLDTGDGALDVAGTTTLSNVAIQIGNYSYLDAYDQGGGAVLTLASNTSIVQTDSSPVLSAGTAANPTMAL